MKTFYVWTHAEVSPTEVEASSRVEALAKGIAITAANPPQIAGGYFGAEYAGSDGRAFIPSRTAPLLADPYARVKPKATTWRRW